MAHYLVTARARPRSLAELQDRLAADEFVSLEPFGQEVSDALRNARRRPDGTAVWEEEDYCDPPLAAEREAVLDQYFDRIDVEAVSAGAGWARVADFPPLFPEIVRI